MTKTVLILLITNLTFFFVSCDKDDSTSPDTDSNVAANLYYPGAAGSTFTYSVSMDNSNAGQRLVTFTQSTDHGGIYLKQTSVGDTSSSVSYFRSTDAGIYFYVDTTGLSSFIPDSLSSVLTLKLDQEVTAFIKSFNTTKNWTAFKMDVNILTIPYNIVTLSCMHMDTEDITLNLTSGSTVMKAEKVKYDMKYTMPSLTGGQPQVQTFTAYVWFVKDVGMAKLEGNATVLNALGGSGIDFADTNKVMTQSLVSYSVK